VYNIPGYTLGVLHSVSSVVAVMFVACDFRSSAHGWVIAIHTNNLASRQVSLVMNVGKCSPIRLACIITKREIMRRADDIPVRNVI